MCSKMKYHDKVFAMGGQIGFAHGGERKTYTLGGHARRESKNAWLSKGYLLKTARMDAFTEKGRDVQIKETDRVCFFINPDTGDARVITRAALAAEARRLNHDRIPVVINPDKEIVAFL